MNLNLAPREGDSGAYEALADLLFRTGMPQQTFPAEYRMQPRPELLRMTEQLKAAMADLERRVVEDYRANGAPWSTIAFELGVTRQAAQKRFGGSA